MAKKPFELNDAANEIEGYIKQAAESGKIDGDLPFSLIERTLGLLKDTIACIEELSDRLEKLEDQSGVHEA